MQWRAATFDSASHASCASYEVEAARAPGSSGGTIRHSCGAKVNECVLANAAPDASYLVRSSPALSLDLSNHLRLHMAGHGSCMQPHAAATWVMGCPV